VTATSLLRARWRWHQPVPRRRVVFTTAIAGAVMGEDEHVTQAKLDEQVNKIGTDTEFSEKMREIFPSFWDRVRRIFRGADHLSHGKT
jgi:hypothetical protein